MKPGIYFNIKNEDYHGGVGISKSGLDLINRSPLHFKAARDAVNDNEATAAQLIGSAFHEFLLEPDLFDQNYVLPFVPPEGALATIDDLKAVLKDAGEKVSGTKPELIERVKAIKPGALILDDLKQQYAITNAGRKILTADAWEQLAAMRASVMAHHIASALLGAPGYAEASAYWIDPKTGELCRVRPDFWRLDGVIVDIKTTEDASPEGFAKSIANWRYHVQDAFYTDGTNQALLQTDNWDHANPVPKDTKAFVFLAVEKKAPYAVGVYILDDESKNLGAVEYRSDLDYYHECNANNSWPGYGDTIRKIALPGWHFNNKAQLLAAAS